ncbi:hypothetical protein MKX01_038873, partial [Papaver californicum]
MIMKVEVVSKEIIKPSCPAPLHLKSFNLSYLDQIAPPSQIGLLLYYTNDNNSENRIISEIDSSCIVLKKSLIIDNRFVDCNDDGMDYFESKVSNCQLSQLIQLPNVQDLAKVFLPFDPFADSDEEGHSTKVLSVQVNVFEDCGGVVIGLCISHKLTDACSVITFMNDVASIARAISPFLTGFKPPTAPSLVVGDDVMVTKKILCLDLPNWRNSRRKPKSSMKLTMFMSTLIWRCFIDTDQAKNKVANPTEVYLALFAINLRARRFQPTVMSKEVDGNNKNDHQYYPYLVGKVRESTQKIDGDYVRDLKTSNAFLDGMKS